MRGQKLPLCVVIGSFRKEAGENLLPLTSSCALKRSEQKDQPLLVPVQLQSRVGRLIIVIPSSVRSGKDVLSGVTKRTRLSSMEEGIIKRTKEILC